MYYVRTIIHGPKVLTCVCFMYILPHGLLVQYVRGKPTVTKKNKKIRYKLTINHMFNYAVLSAQDCAFFEP